jgi:predicted enzyme related to lactoylglutathione lyase
MLTSVSIHLYKMPQKDFHEILKLKRGGRDMTSESFSKTNVPFRPVWPVSAFARLIKRFYRIPLFLVAAVVITGCTAILPKVPPLGSEGTSLPGKVVWHDLVTPDMDKAKNFYAGLFDWSFEELSDGYALARHNGRLVAGVAKLDRSGRSSNWLPLVSVPDMDRLLTEATVAGGKIILKPFDLPSRGRVAVLRDPQGAAFGVVQSSHGDPADRKADVNEWLWNEVWTDDVPSAVTFYQTVGGYRLAEKTVGDIQYRFLERDGQPRVGLLDKPSPHIGNTWVAYIRVADVDATVNKAKALGGNVLMAPTVTVRNGTVAVIADPNGAGFVVQEWNK